MNGRVGSSLARRGACPRSTGFSEPSGYIEGGAGKVRLIHGSIAKAEQTFAAATRSEATGKVSTLHKNCVRGK